MSMHEIPMTLKEEQAVRKHKLVVGSPSQLTDSFRIGYRYSRNEIIDLLLAMSDEEKNIAMGCHEGTPGRSHCLAKSAALAQAADAISNL